ncbi:unnamed protein product [Ixodes hexagonus]
MGAPLWRALGQLLVVTCCCTVLGSKIRLEDQGYVDIVVAVDRRVPEDPVLITNLRALLSETSTLLHQATRELVYLKSVTIVLPHTWRGAAEYPMVPGALEADINVVQSDDDPPSTVQPGGCGEPGLSIELPAGFVLNLNGTTRDNYRRPEYVMVHEWAHFRYGVFDEYGSPNDPNYPAVYMRNGKRMITACSADIRASLETLTGSPCQLTEGAADPDCVAFSPIDELTEASSSIMFMPPLSSVSISPGSNMYVKTAVKATNPRNFRSCFLVDGFGNSWMACTLMKSGRIPEELTVCPKKSSSSFPKAHLLTLTTSPYSTRRANSSLRCATCSSADMLVDGAETSMILSASSAILARPMSPADARTILTLPIIRCRNNSRSTLLPACSVTLRQELERNGETAENAALLLMTDGEENEEPYIKDVLPTVLKKRVRVFSVPVGKEADDGLRLLSERTGENVYSITNTTNLADKLSEMFAAVITTQQEKSERRETVFKRAVPLTSARTSLDVMVDNELGRNTMFIATGAPGDTTAMMAVSPSGREILAQYDYDLQRHKVVVNQETGKWRVVLVSHPLRRIDDTVTVTVTSEAQDPGVQPVRMRSFLSSRSLESVGSSTLFKIYAELRKENVPVVGARVFATVTTPLGSQVHVPLRDRGDGADVRAGDGIYSAFFSGFNRPGRYSVDVEAEGNSETRLGFPKTNSEPSSHGWRRAKRSIPVGDSRAVEFSRYENAGSFVVHRLQRAVVYPPASVRDLRVESASRSGNGSRHVTVSWTSPGAHLDQDACTRLQLHASTSPSSLLSSQKAQSVHVVTEPDVTSGTLIPSVPGARQLIAFQLPTMWLAANESAHDVHFVLFTWNSEGLRSNRSNLATANFPQIEAAIQRDKSFWDEFSSSSAAMYGCTALLALALGGVVCLLVLSWLRTHRTGLYPVAVFRTSPMKGEVERACRVNLLSHA